MDESYEFRLFPRAGVEVLGGQLGEQRVAAVVRGDVGDERYAMIGQLHRQWKERGEAGAFAGWLITRTYSAEEQETASSFWLDLPSQNVALEEHGTKYDDSRACAKCGLGGQPKEPIFAKTRLLGNRDIVRLLSGELLISNKLLKLLQESECTGYETLPVLESGTGPGGKSVASPFWLLSIQSRVHVDMDRTRFGADPFDTESRGACVCDSGRLAGYAPLTALKLADGLSEGDLALSDIFVGTRRGLLRPYQLMVVSKRLLHLLQDERVAGICAEPILDSAS